MAKPINDIVIKGKTIGTHLESEKGRGLMRWIIEQPIQDDKFKSWAIGRNKFIKEKLELYNSDPQVQESPGLEQTAMEAMAFQLKNHEDRIKKLENCLSGEPKEPEGEGWPVE